MPPVVLPPPVKLLVSAVGALPPPSKDVLAIVAKLVAVDITEPAIAAAIAIPPSNLGY
jgi:hypothetical protein